MRNTKIARTVALPIDEFITACVEIAAQEFSKRVYAKDPSVRAAYRQAANRAYQIYVARKARHL